MTRELDVAIEAAKAAGEILREGFGGERTLKYKDEVDIVTKMDERAERIISEVLMLPLQHLCARAESLSIPHGPWPDAW